MSARINSRVAPLADAMILPPSARPRFLLVREDLLGAVRRFTGIALGRCGSTLRVRILEASRFFCFACRAVP
jgi:hypothetical protein